MADEIWVVEVNDFAVIGSGWKFLGARKTEADALLLADRWLRREPSPFKKYSVSPYVRKSVAAEKGEQE